MELISARKAEQLQVLVISRRLTAGIVEVCDISNSLTRHTPESLQLKRRLQSMRMRLIRYSKICERLPAALCPRHKLIKSHLLQLLHQDHHAARVEHLQKTVAKPGGKIKGIEVIEGIVESEGDTQVAETMALRQEHTLPRLVLMGMEALVDGGGSEGGVVRGEAHEGPWTHRAASAMERNLTSAVCSWHLAGDEQRIPECRHELQRNRPTSRSNAMSLSWQSWLR